MTEHSSRAKKEEKHSGHHPTNSPVNIYESVSQCTECDGRQKT